MLRPVPTRLGALRFGADPVPTGPKPGFYTDTGGYAWELSANGTLTAIASPGAPAAFAPWSPGYATILAKVTTGKTTWTREQVMKSAVQQGGHDLSIPVAPVAPIARSAAVRAQAPTSPAPAEAAENTIPESTPGSSAGTSSMPGWVLPVAAVTGAAGLALILFPNLLTPATWGAPPAYPSRSAPAGRWTRHA